MKKVFIKIVFDLNYKNFIVYIAVFNSFNLNTKIYSLYKTYIAHLKINKIFTKVFNKYIDIVNIFFLKLVIKLLKYISINYYIIKLIDNKKKFYNYFYNLGFIKLKILKTYIKNNLIYDFIKLSKFFIKISVFLIKNHIKIFDYI